MIVGTNSTMVFTYNIISETFKAGHHIVLKRQMNEDFYIYLRFNTIVSLKIMILMKNLLSPHRVFYVVKKKKPVFIKSLHTNMDITQLAFIC